MSKTHNMGPQQTVSPLIIDIAGTELTAVDQQRLLHPLVGGMILFGRNWQNRAQLTQLCHDIKALRADLLIAVDHEGGRVQRFRSDGLTHLPAMRTLGQLWSADETAFGDAALRACAAATATGYVLGAELRACGVDFSFTPVLDLDHGGSSVIGDRAFARQPQVVAALAQALMHGLRQAGMANCGKHFPGHGYAVADSHVAMPIDERPLPDILTDDAMPYAWLSGALSSVMPAHVIYSQVDARPAGFSAFWLQQVLRQQLGFVGAVFTDDLSMRAARQLDGRELSYTEAAITALESGCDLALLCNQSLVDGGRVIDDFLAGMETAAAEGRWQPRLGSEARRLALLPLGAASSWDALQQDERYRQARALLP